MSYLFLGAGIAGTLLLIISLIFENSFHWLCKNPRTCFFCPTVVFTMIMVFGYSGAIMVFVSNYSSFKILLLSLGLSAISSVITNIALWKFRKIEDETLIERDLISSQGVVTTPIPAGGYGEVEVDVAGSTFSVTASSNDSLGEGEGIVVEAITSPGIVKVIPQNPHG